MNLPENLRYAESHEWVALEGNKGRVGITDHAQSELSDVVYVELPEVGIKVEAGQAIAVVESVKAASDIYAPVSGTVVAVNSALESDPALINTDAFGEGWLFELEVDSADDVQKLKSAAEYQTQVEG